MALATIIGIAHYLLMGGLAWTYIRTSHRVRNTLTEGFKVNWRMIWDRIQDNMGDVE